MKYGVSDEAQTIETTELNRIYGDSVKPKKRQCWTCRSIKIPPTVPSGLEKCNIIDINYEVLVSMKVYN